jgi:hypothetical protein
MKGIFISLSLLVTLTANAQCTDLFFSEYLEGASNNKALEIYNPTASVINLSDYVLYRYNNGSPIPTDSLFPAGLLAAGDVFVAGNPSAVAAILSESDTLHTITFYNGDDALSLKKISTGTVLDVIGQIGTDPGTNWPVGAGATSEFTLVRMATISGGNIDWAITSTQWDVYPQNTVSFLGSHSMNPCCVHSAFTDVQTECDSYLWIDGNTYNASNNTATHIIPNAAGCDSLITLDLTIIQSTAYTDVQSACDSYLWIDGNTYNASNNTATHTIPNAAGCDSLITLDLTINQSTAYTDVQSACDSYLWIDGNTYNTSNNTATHTIPNAAGCDSLITLDLTINQSTAYTDVQSACDSYLWIDGNTYNASNNTATHTIPNAAGCDSIITLDLTVNQSTAFTDVQSACDSYLWIDGNTYNASNNTATHTIPNAAGCDSVITLDLTLNASSSATQVENALDSFTWPVNGQTYVTGGQYVAVISNAAGCDSTITLDLTLNYTGLNESEIVNFTFYPNPVLEVLTIESVEQIEGSYFVIDLTGSLVQKGMLELETTYINLGHLKTGSYFIRFSGYSEVLKFMKL